MDSERHRNKVVRLHSLTKKQLQLMGTSLVIIMAAIIGLAFIMPSKVITGPAPQSTNIPLLDYVCESSPSIVDDAPGISDLIPSCWSSFFTFNTRLTQYFDLELTLYREGGGLQLEEDAFDIPLHITWTAIAGEAADGGNDNKGVGVTTIASSSVKRKITCGKGSVACQTSVLFRSTNVNYGVYSFQVQVLDEASMETHFNTATFSFSYENWDYTVTRIVTATVLQVTSIGTLLYYYINLKDLKRQFRSYEQKWVLSLCVALFLYNNPCYILAHALPWHYFGWLDLLFQCAFVGTLLLFWLVVLDGMTKEPPFSLWSFYMPKVALLTLWLVVSFVAFVTIAVEDYQDPLRDVNQYFPLLTFIISYAALGGAVYLLLAAYLTCKGLAVRQQMSSRQKTMFAYHVSVLLITAVACGAGAVFQGSRTTSSGYLFFALVFNIYVVSLAYLYLPSPSLTPSDDVTEAEMERSKSGDYGGSITLPLDSRPISLAAIQITGDEGDGDHDPVPMDTRILAQAV